MVIEVEDEAKREELFRAASDGEAEYDEEFSPEDHEQQSFYEAKQVFLRRMEQTSRGRQQGAVSNNKLKKDKRSGTTDQIEVIKEVQPEEDNVSMHSRREY